MIDRWPGGWGKFPWHRYADRPNSSQALALSVFGTIATHTRQDDIIGAIAATIGLPSAGPWTLHPEWKDPDALLNEPTPTQIDAYARSPYAALVIEAKFTEALGSCSQVDPKLQQCNGRYETQTNPVNGMSGRCALTAKNIAYWRYIPTLFDRAHNVDHAPCPFAGSNYQLMRNAVLAEALRQRHKIAAAVILAYPDHAGIHTVEWLKEKEGFLSVRAMAHDIDRWFRPLSYQRIIDIAGEAAPGEEWSSLAGWVSARIAMAQTRLAPSAGARSRRS